MANLTIENFPSGWIPSDDNVNGRKDGLIVMDNLKLDEYGIVSITQGALAIHGGSLSAPITAIYSKTFNDVKHRFVSLNSGDVLVNRDGWFEYLFTGSSNKCTFSSGLGHVFMFSGNVKKKYDGNVIFNLTPEAPASAPTVQIEATPEFLLVDRNQITGFSLLTGSNLEQGQMLSFKTETDSGVVHKVFSNPVNTYQMTDNKVGNAYDTFHIWLFADAPENIKGIRVIFYISPQIDPLADYYYFDWAIGGNASVNLGRNTWTHFKCVRHDFRRSGSTPNCDWDTCYGIRVIVDVSDETLIKIMPGGILFKASIDGAMDGQYEYMQVNVYQSGTYIGKSVMSPPSKPIHLNGNRALITPVPSTDPQVNCYWIYRRDASWRSDVRERGAPKRLTRWYRVAVRYNTEPFVDAVGDHEAILENVVYDESMESVQKVNNILMSTNIWNGRFVYITEKDVLFSDEFDPGLFCPFWNITLSGSKTERNLWIKATSMNQILVGTTENIYEISGTGASLPDGTLDIRVTPVGVGYPPIHQEAIVYESSVIYIASDGIRTIGGGNYSKLSADLDLLFNGYYRHNIPPIKVKLYNTGNYSLAVSKGKLYFAAEHIEGPNSVFIYDIKHNYWRRWTINADYLYTEEDDTLLIANDNYVRYQQNHGWVDYGEYKPRQRIRLVTPYNHNGQPRNRKDSFTLKITADTDGDPVHIALSKDPKEGWVSIATVGFNGKETKMWDISDKIGYAFMYALYIEGDVHTFKLYSYTIEYNPLPEQLLYFHNGNTNFGTYSRKRMAALPIVIDPIGGSVSMTVYLDGVNIGTQTITGHKQTYPFYLNTDIPFVDLDFILKSETPFEYYGISEGDLVIEKLPPSAKYLKLPSLFNDGLKRRVRTIPLLLNPRGGNVTFSAIVDNNNINSSTFSGNSSRTYFHYFTTDVQGVDYAGVLYSDVPFEFSGYGTPEVVEVFPMFKKFDQVGPVELRKVGRLIGFRLCINPLNNTSISYKIYSEDNTIQVGSIIVEPNKQAVYTVEYLPKTLKSTIFRMELGPCPEHFHRYWVELKVSLTGNDSELEVIRL